MMLPSLLRRGENKSRACALCCFSVAIILGFAVSCSRLRRITPKSSSSASTKIGLLLTENALWKHEKGHLCLQGTSFQSITIDPEEPDVLHVTEIIDGGKTMYMYEMIHTKALLEELANLTDLSWIHALEKVKYNCVQQSLEEREYFDASNPLLVTSSDKEDRYLWSVAHWTVETDRHGDIPRILHFPNYDSQHGVADASMHMEIYSTGTCELVTIQGCDPINEAGDDHLPSIAVSVAMVDDALRATGHNHNETRRELLHRYLQGDFVPEITGTNWCGVGAPSNPACPSKDLASSFHGCYDLSADQACRRHDHGVKFTRLLGGSVVRSECINDHDLATATDNWAVEATYGSAGLSSTWGCHAYGPYDCWKSWKFGPYCCGAHVRFGYGRYNNIARYSGWGYRKPDNVCSGDLWKCTDSSCTALDPKAPETAKQCA